LATVAIAILTLISIDCGVVGPPTEFDTSTTTYSLTVNVNPFGGGTTTRSPNQASYAAGTRITLTATTANGYAFVNWTVTPIGAATFANASNANTTVTLNSDATITANFRLLIERKIDNVFTTTTNHIHAYTLPSNIRFPAIIEVYALGGGGGGQGGCRWGQSGSYEVQTSPLGCGVLWLFPCYETVHYTNWFEGTGGAGGGDAAAYMKFNVTGSTHFNINLGNGGRGGDGVSRAAGVSWRSGFRGSDGNPTTVTWSGNTLTAAGGRGGGEGRADDIGTDATGRIITGGSGGLVSSRPQIIVNDSEHWRTISGGRGENGSQNSCVASRGGNAANIDNFGGTLGGSLGCPNGRIGVSGSNGSGGSGGRDNSSGGRGGDGQVRIIITYFE